MQAKTFMAKAQDIEKKWYIVDAADKPLGRTASEVAKILRGKHKPEFTPHVDTGDHVIVINAEKAVLTGKKLQNKVRYHHTGYPGGIRAVNYETLMREKPDRAMYLAVKGMLPQNKLGRAMLKKIRVYRDDKHNNEAQKPVKWEN